MNEISLTSHNEIPPQDSLSVETFDNSVSPGQRIARRAMLNPDGSITSLALAFFIAGLLAFSTALSFGLWQGNHAITDENALLELAQCGFLLLTVITQGILAVRSGNAGLARDLRVGLALFTLLFFLREVDIDKLGTDPGWAVLEKVLRGLALTMMLGFIVHLSRRTKLIIRSLGEIFTAPMVLVSLLACVFYVCGWPFDKGVVNIDKSLSVWFEETLELNACLLFFSACFIGGVKSVAVEAGTPVAV